MNTSTKSNPPQPPCLLIDSHAHLSTDELQPDLEVLLTRAQAAGIEHIVNICTTPQELKRGLEIARKHPWVHTAGSTTPHDAAADGERDFEIFANHARAGDLVAVGETGLDYYYYKESAAIQQDMTRRYLRLADECKLPLVIHCRDAFEDFFNILDTEREIPGVLHCFTGNEAEARGVIERGWYLSLSGIATFKKSGALRDIAKIVPKDRLLIETDTPYLAPHPFRSKRNEPAFLVETANCLAEVLNIPVKELAAQTAANASRLFGI